VVGGSEGVLPCSRRREVGVNRSRRGVRAAAVAGVARASCASVRGFASRAGGHRDAPAGVARLTAVDGRGLPHEALIEPYAGVGWAW
jgi:hypothetical protein